MDEVTVRTAPHPVDPDPATASVRRRHRVLSVLAGAGLFAFEAVEWGWIGFHPLQLVFMVVGIAVIVLSSVSDKAPKSGAVTAR